MVLRDSRATPELDLGVDTARAMLVLTLNTVSVRRLRVRGRHKVWSRGQNGQDISSN